MTTVVWGEGRTYPASSVGGARSTSEEEKVARVEIVRRDGTVEQIDRNCVLTLEPGERFITRSAGGGLWAPPLARAAEKVVEDVREGFVSRAGAREEYGVVLDEETLEIDADATARLPRADGLPR